jgi:hypothetical protein
MKINFRSISLPQFRTDLHRIGWSSISEHNMQSTSKYLSHKTKPEDFDESLLIEMIYDICHSDDQSLLLGKLEKKYIKTNKIKITDINILETYLGVTDIFYLVWEVPCVVDMKKTKYRKECVFTYDSYTQYIRNKKLNEIGI